MSTDAKPSSATGLRGRHSIITSSTKLRSCSEPREPRRRRLSNRIGIYSQRLRGSSWINALKLTVSKLRNDKWPTKSHVKTNVLPRRSSRRMFSRLGPTRWKKTRWSEPLPPSTRIGFDEWDGWQLTKPPTNRWPLMPAFSFLCSFILSPCWFGLCFNFCSLKNQIGDSQSLRLDHARAYFD